MSLCWGLFSCEWMRKGKHHDTVGDRKQSGPIHGLDNVPLDNGSHWSYCLRLVWAFSSETTSSDQAEPSTNINYLFVASSLMQARLTVCSFGSFLKSKTGWHWKPGQTGRNWKWRLYILEQWLYLLGLSVNREKSWFNWNGILINFSETGLDYKK